MILPLLLLLAAAPDTDAGRFAACTNLVGSDPAHAIEVAGQWRKANGGLLARQCLGLAFAAAERWPEAAAAFEEAARDAELQRDGRAATLWSQAGNAALAGGDPGRARGFLDRALALPVVPPQMRGELYLDRGRADVAASDPAAARTDIDQALALVPRDPMAWLLSATLARRVKDAPRAVKDAAEAVRLAPDDAATHYEQGNAAFIAGDTVGARTAWNRAVLTGAATPAGRAARAALDGVPVP